MSYLSIIQKNNDKISFLSRLKLYNRARLERRMINNIIKTNIPNRNKRHRPNKITNFLFIEIQEGWGDFVYFLGLLKALHSAGLTIDVVSLPNTYQRYFNLSFVRNAYSISDQDLAAKISKNNYDIAFDITYVNDKRWDLRRKLLANLNCYTITAGNITAHSNLFDSFIDLGKAAHWQDRNTIIFDYIIQPTTSIGPIPPTYIDNAPQSHIKSYLNNLDKESNYIYVNTITRSPDRSLSESQVQELIKLFNERKKSVGIFYTSINFQETEFVNPPPKMSFNDLINIIKNCKAIVSPDTSVVHLGSIYNIPVLGFYCGNFRDYWTKYPQANAWAPISQMSDIFYEDDPNTDETSDFIYTHKKKIVSSYPPIKIKSLADQFLSKLGL